MFLADWRGRQAPPDGRGDRQIAKDGGAQTDRGTQQDRGAKEETGAEHERCVSCSAPLSASPAHRKGRGEAAGESGANRAPLRVTSRGGALGPLAVADGVLVLHFDVTAETSRNKSLGNLLDGNGITLRSEHEQMRLAGGTEIVSVYVEALPAQAAGILAALAAQPGVFRSLDVTATLGQPAQQIVAEYGRRIEGPSPTALPSPLAAERVAPSPQTNQRGSGCCSWCT